MGHKVLHLMQAGFISHVQIPPIAHTWYIWSGCMLSKHLGFLCKCSSRGAVTPTECPMDWLEPLQEFPGNHPKGSQSTRTRTNLTQVPDTQAHSTPDNKSLQHNRKPFSGRRWTSWELAILALASGQNCLCRDFKFFRTQMAKFDTS